MSVDDRPLADEPEREPSALPPEEGSEPEPSVSISSDDKTWAMLAHLLTISGFVIPLGNIIAPLVIWLVKKETSKFVDYHGKESLNFQINILVYLLVSIPLVFCVVGIFTMIAASLYGLIMAIIAGINASSGQWYRYPYTFRLIK